MKLTLENLQRMTDRRLQSFVEFLAGNGDGSTEIKKLLEVAICIQQCRSARREMYRAWYR